MKAFGGLILAAALLFMFAGEQMGPGDFGGPQTQPASGIRHRVNFDEVDVIDATRPAPDIEKIEARPRQKFPNLIKYRDNFSEKILGSVNAL
ncbi:MAG: hypothetical protein HY897_23010 [Deltaproteobacteria bacterium]|nr:hypothetical protein [Deltaproteobacteria bacterium]